MKRRLVWLVILLTLVAGCNGSWSSGDRVLVNKAAYDLGVGRPKRYDIVVFRCPETPRHSGPLDNFIKRLLGLAGETLAIFFGHLFVTTDWQPPEDLDAEHAGLDPTQADPLQLWRLEYMYRDDANARALFTKGRFQPRQGKGVKTGKFEILRKDPEVMLALRRSVYDNDHPAKDLQDAHFPPRWASRQAGPWREDGDRGFTITPGGQDAWLDYHHILRPLDWPGGKDRTHTAQLITDFSGYNSYVSAKHPGTENGGNWVGDLMLDFELTVDRAEGELWLDMARGVDRFQARWDLASGRCALWRLQDGKKPEKLKEADTAVKQPGTYHLRFANFDERLTVWVDRDLPFGDGVAYPRAWYYNPDKMVEGKRAPGWENTGPTANDLKPASVCSKGAAVKLRHLQLWRNTYYTVGGDAGQVWDARLPQPDIPDRLRDPLLLPDRRERDAVIAEHWEKFWSSPDDRWDPLKRLNFATFYVQKGHYMCLGDNSPESSDSRAWGTVPERLMLGRALMVYYPFTRAGLIR